MSIGKHYINSHSVKRTMKSANAKKSVEVDALVRIDDVGNTQALLMLERPMSRIPHIT